MRQEYFTVYGEYISLKNINVSEEYAKSILPYIENTPIDIKLGIYRRIFDSNQKKS